MCCYLLYSGQKATADEALKFYGTKRTHDEKGKNFLNIYFQSPFTFAINTIRFCSASLRRMRNVMTLVFGERTFLVK